MMLWFDAYLQAVSWVKEAGDSLRAEMGAPVEVQTKSSYRDLVTRYDVETERFLTGKLREQFPEHRIFGEESQSAGEGEVFTDLNGPVWFVDPIDGTMNFVKLRREFGIMLALYVDGEAQIGIVYDVMRDELFSSLRGYGSYCNGRRLPMLPSVSLQESLVIVEGGAVARSDAQTLAVIERCMSARMIACSAIVTTVLARAGAGAFLAMNQQPWDCAAPKAILEEIGARFSAPDGGTLSLLRGEPVLMALPGIAEEIIALYPHD